MPGLMQYPAAEGSQHRHINPIGFEAQVMTLVNCDGMTTGGNHRFFRQLFQYQNAWHQTHAQPADRGLDHR